MALSVQERRVLELAADGLSDRDIAAALGMSHDAVRKTISRAYQKNNIAHPGRGNHSKDTTRRALGIPSGTQQRRRGLLARFFSGELFE